MQLLWTVIIGFVIGLLARMIMPGRDSFGFILTTLLGIGGAIVGAFLGQGLGLYAMGEPAGFFASILGALLVLFIYQKVSSSGSIATRQ